MKEFQGVFSSENLGREQLGLTLLSLEYSYTWLGGINPKGMRDIWSRREDDVDGL